MEKECKYYEAMFIVDVTDGETAVKETVAKFVNLIKDNAETVVDVDEWGKRRLAYLIDDKPEGYYVVVTFKASPDFPAEFERLATIDENILRVMVVKLPFVPQPKEPVVEEAPAVEEAPVEEAPAEEKPAEEAPAVEAPADAE